jgi:hypothetical protein
MDAVMQRLEIVRLLLLCEGRVHDSGVKGDNFLQALKFS